MSSQRTSEFVSTSGTGNSLTAREAEEGRGDAAGAAVAIPDAVEGHFRAPVEPAAVPEGNALYAGW